VSTRHDRFDLDFGFPMFALQKCALGQIAGVSNKNLASEAKVAQEELGCGVRLGGMSGVKFGMGCYWVPS
jgi:hypothetical protein